MGRGRRWPSPSSRCLSVATPGPRAGHRGDGAGCPDVGAAAVEFALIAPLLLLLLFWIFEFGWQLWELQAGQAAAREVARLAAVGVGDPSTFVRGAACLALHDGVGAGQLQRIHIGFSSDTAGRTALRVTDQDGYVNVSLTYRSALTGLLPTPLSSGGSYTRLAVSRLEQMPAARVLTGIDAMAPTRPCS